MIHVISVASMVCATGVIVVVSGVSVGDVSVNSGISISRVS